MSFAFAFCLILCFEGSFTSIQGDTFASQNANIPSESYSQYSNSRNKDSLDYFPDSFQSEINVKKYAKEEEFPSISVVTGDYVNITCMQFEYSNHNWKKYPAEANYGYRCSDLNAWASVTFYGTRVYLEGNVDNRNDEIEIRIDRKKVARINTYASGMKTHLLLFDSEDLDYGQHTINITRLGTDTNNKMDIANILVRPLPKHGGKVVNFQTIKSELGLNWKWGNENTIGNVPISHIFCEKVTECPTISIPFYGTKCWVSGVRARGYRTISFAVDNGNQKTVDLAIRSLGVMDYSLHDLLYVSDDLPLGKHTLVISDESAYPDPKVDLVNIFYLIQPTNATIVPANTFTEIKNGIVNSDDSITLNDGSAQFNIYGTTFWIFGQDALTTNDIQINLNKSPQDSLTIYSTDDRLKMSHLNLSKESFDKYSIDIISKGQITVNFAYYLNEQKYTVLPNANTIQHDDSRVQKPESWTELVYKESEGISTTTQDSTLTINFEGTQFWIEGSYDPSFGLVEILLNDDILARVSLYREKHDANVIYYESESKPLADYELKLRNIDGKEISFNKFYFLSPSYSFTLSSYFSNSQSFSESTDFTQSTQFSQSTHFSQSVQFSKSRIFSNSDDFTLSSQFTRSISFSISDDFTDSSHFSTSNYFSDSISFTLSPSNLFTLSVSFSESNSFTLSISFSESNSFLPEAVEGNKNPPSIGLIVGVVLAVLVVVVLIIIIIFILRRNRNQEQSDIDSFECSALYQNSVIDHTKDDPIEGPDSFIPYDPFNQAIEEEGK